MAILPPAQSQKRIAERSQSEKPQKQGRSKKSAVKVVFLGGVGEIGKNMTALECGDDIIIIDAGAIFPTEEMPGIDLVVPDLSYLIENKHKVRGLVLTHGHEDHIGGVPYLLKEMNIPVAGTRLTLALVDNKLREHRLNNVREVTVAPGEHLQWGCFKIDFINVNHSIAGALALAIHTPQGVIFHSGDFKIDLTPVAGDPIDLKTIADLGGKGVLLYMGESTNIERPGYTMSEAVVGETLERLVGENNTRRVIIATFASNVHRLQQIIDIAVRHKRRVALNGRSMLNVVDAAQKLGELHIPDGVLVDISRTRNLRDDEVLIVCTGSQGEPMSALHRMANGENPALSVGSNDTIIISASPIPGNERDVYGVINKLYHLGADVVYERLENIHVSGHACREEHKIMHTLLKPKYFIPVHGEYRHLMKHSKLAQSLGMSERNIFIPDLGNCVELTSKTMRKLADIPAGSRLIDGEGIEDEKASLVMQDRRQLAQEGIFIVSVAVSGGEVIGEPVINSRGFVFDFHRDYNKEMREVINKAIAGYDLPSGSVDELKRVIKRALRNYLVRKTKQSPMVVPVVVEL
ncbi:MAG TPA: ribonuclease J [Candidatus Coproplasma avicola]|uniref:Ribonuclease J n=1 Tax=Candidatus Coproplasma avicola TaxID=2840744 RepID=A0A9D1E593_9FIRM|nr:ribonuclease J [Candidatus Coproplasma avicola]